MIDPADIEGAQRAAAVLAARAQGRPGDAVGLLGEFDTHADLAAAFMTVAELAVQLHGADTGQPPEDFLAEIALGLAAAHSDLMT